MSPLSTVAPHQTLTELWHFRLKGAPEPIYRRALGYFNLVNSPSTMVNADDLWNFRKSHEGLMSDGGDWVSLHRYAGQDEERNGAISLLDVRNLARCSADGLA